MDQKTNCGDSEYNVPKAPLSSWTYTIVDICDCIKGIPQREHVAKCLANGIVFPFGIGQL